MKINVKYTFTIVKTVEIDEGDYDWDEERETRELADDEELEVTAEMLFDRVEQELDDDQDEVLESIIDGAEITAKVEKA